jgi:hypothetical protein
LSGSVNNTQFPFAPLGQGDWNNVKSSPIYAPNNVHSVEMDYRDAIIRDMPLGGDMLSEKKNDPRGRKLQTSIETLTGVEQADIFHPNIYYEPAVNPKEAFMNLARHRATNVDAGNQPVAWGWQDIALRQNNRDPEVFVGFTYDTSMNPTLPAQSDVYTVGDNIPRPYTPTEPRMGPQLYDAPQIVGIGFDERNPPPDPFTTTHSTSSVTSTTGAGIQVDGGRGAKRNLDELDKNSNPNFAREVSDNKEADPMKASVLGRVQRRRRDTYNSANQTNPWGLTSNPVIAPESIPANIGHSM